ncbi:MAG: hypothetical protein ACTSRS_00765 [Candidatus Helarchaeota archaeon]
MSDPVAVLGQKLDEIIMKLEAMAEGVATLITIIEKTNAGLGENVKNLTESIEKYTDMMTENLKNDFEQSRSSINKVTQEINSLKQVTGTEQITRITNALNGILSLLHQNINPEQIQAQLIEINQFIKTYGGQKP